MQFGNSIAPQGWQQLSLEDICLKITSGGTPNRKNYDFYNNGKILWVKTKELNNYFIHDTEEKITKDALNKSSAKLLPKDTILLAMYGATVGELGILSKEMACNQACCALIINPKIADFRFVFYLLKLYKEKIKGLATGAAQQNLSTTTIKGFTFNFPPLLEQQKIADFLFGIDDKIQLNTQTNQTLEQIAQAIYKSWFVDYEPTRAKAAVLAAGGSMAEAETAAMTAISGKTAAELAALKQHDPARYQQLADLAAAFPAALVPTDDFGEIPAGWEVKRIEDVIQKIPVGKKYSQKTVTEKGKVPVLDQGKSGLIGYHNDKAGVQASLENPVIVFANHTCYMRLITYDFSAIQNVFAFRGKNCNVLWLYLATLGKQQFVEYKGHFPDFLIKDIVVPPDELTEIFGRQVEYLFYKMSINNKENKNLSEIRDTLLPKLLRGNCQDE